MYVLSGFLFPIIIFFNSNKNFLIYNFNNNKLNRKNISNISILIISTLFILLIIFSKYILNFIYLSIQLLNEYNIYIDKNIVPEYIFYILVLPLLVNKRSMIFLKRTSIVIYLLTSSLLWLTTNNILKFDYIYTYEVLIFNKFIPTQNVNIKILINLLLIEIIYYFWSYITNDNNLSNWTVLVPSRRELYPILYIFMFYTATLFYYFNLNYN